MNRVVLSFVALCMMAAGSASSADFRVERNHIAISGRIENDDLSKFRTFLKDPAVLDKLLSGAVALDSPGGNVAAALGIARILHLAHASVILKSNATCLSACVLIFAGASYRLMASNSVLGVHRLSFPEAASIAETEKMLANFGGSIEGFLRTAGIPERVIEKSRETPPTEIFRVTPRWLNENGLQLDYRPAFIDVVVKRCGTEPLLKGRDTGQDAWLQCMEEVRSKEQQSNKQAILGAVFLGR